MLRFNYNLRRYNNFVLISVIIICVISDYCVVNGLKGDHICHQSERYLTQVRKPYKKPVRVRGYKWCLQVPPRCEDDKTVLVDDFRIEEEEAVRQIEVCCPGYQEDKTTDRCISTNCPECENGICDKDRRCICLDGFIGLNCNQKCNDGLWGKNCSQKCHCSDHGSCHHISGKCICNPGWQGSRCESNCAEGTYGVECSYRCECLNGVKCDPVIGSCSQELKISTNDLEPSETRTYIKVEHPLLIYANSDQNRLGTTPENLASEPSTLSYRTRLQQVYTSLQRQNHTVMGVPTSKFTVKSPIPGQTTLSTKQNNVVQGSDSSIIYIRPKKPSSKTTNVFKVTTDRTTFERYLDSKEPTTQQVNEDNTSSGLNVTNFFRFGDDSIDFEKETSPTTTKKIAFNQGREIPGNSKQFSASTIPSTLSTKKRAIPRPESSESNFDYSDYRINSEEDYYITNHITPSTTTRPTRKIETTKSPFTSTEIQDPTEVETTKEIDLRDDNIRIPFGTVNIEDPWYGNFSKAYWDFVSSTTETDDSMELTTEEQPYVEFTLEVTPTPDYEFHIVKYPISRKSDLATTKTAYHKPKETKGIRPPTSTTTSTKSTNILAEVSENVTSTVAVTAYESTSVASSNSDTSVLEASTRSTEISSTNRNLVIISSTQDQVPQEFTSTSTSMENSNEVRSSSTVAPRFDQALLTTRVTLDNTTRSKDLNNVGLPVQRQDDSIKDADIIPNISIFLPKEATVTPATSTIKTTTVNYTERELRKLLFNNSLPRNKTSIKTLISLSIFLNETLISNITNTLLNLSETGQKLNTSLNEDVIMKLLNPQPTQNQPDFDDDDADLNSSNVQRIYQAAMVALLGIAFGIVLAILMSVIIWYTTCTRVDCRQKGVTSPTGNMHFIRRNDFSTPMQERVTIEPVFPRESEITFGNITDTLRARYDDTYDHPRPVSAATFRGSTFAPAPVVPPVRQTTTEQFYYEIVPAWTNENYANGSLQRTSIVTTKL